MRIHGALVTYRRPRELAAMLHALSLDPLTTLVVVDNSPSSAAKELVESSGAAETIEYIASPANVGPAGGLAVAFKRTLELAEDDDWILSLDDDDPPDRRDIAWLREYTARCLKEDSRTGCVGKGGAVLNHRTGFLSTPPAGQVRVRVDHIPGNKLPLYRVQAVREVGVFNENLFFGFEELEFGLRVTDAGWNIYYDGVIPREQTHSSPKATLREPSWRTYYSRRNLIWILRDRGAWPAALLVSVLFVAKPLANMLFAPRLGVRALRLNVRGLVDGWVGRMGRRVEPSY